MYHVGLVYTETAAMTEAERQKDPHRQEQQSATVKAIEAALLHNGHRVTLIPASEHLLSDITAIGGIDIIFNVCSGIKHRKQQANIVGMLELLEIPFVGSGLSAQIIGMHKALTKRIFRAVGVPTAAFQVFITGEEELDESLNFPLIVKPEHEGSSRGIDGNSVVYDREALYRQIHKIIEEFNQFALVEEFIPGREFTIGVLGTIEPKVLPLIEIHFDRSDEFQTLDMKSQDNYHIQCPADLSRAKAEELEYYAIRAYKAIGCNDFARIDVRMDEAENPFFIEVNTLPGMQPGYSDFPKAAEAAGLAYHELVEELMREAMADAREKIKKKRFSMKEKN